MVSVQTYKGVPKLVRADEASRLYKLIEPLYCSDAADRWGQYSFRTLYNHRIYVAAYWLKERIVEPEKQPLLGNGSETALISRQRPRNRGITFVARQHILNKQE
jgi:hypothetical protein